MGEIRTERGGRVYLERIREKKERERIGKQTCYIRGEKR